MSRGNHLPVRSPVLRPAISACLVCLLLGCSEMAPEYTEVKRIDEPVTPAELEAFLRIARDLPDGRLPKLPAVFLPPPEWSATRTLPVSELVVEERQRIEERWSVDWLTSHLERSRALDRVLKREQLTTGQFVGLWLTLGAAMSRSTVREDQDLDRLVERGTAVVEGLLQDKRPFSEHSQVARHAALSQAVWLTRVARARRLREVPLENLELIRERHSTLAELLPPEFMANPFDSITDPLEEWGIPFEELPESGTDDQLGWDANEALIGQDPLPDGGAAPRIEDRPDTEDARQR